MVKHSRPSAALVLLMTHMACGGMPASSRNNIQYSELISGPAAPSGIRIDYGPDSLQFGELRLPSGRKSVPLVVLIHGGCWQAAYDIAHISHASDALTRAGYATWTIEYRRVGNAGGGWPGTFADIAHGLDYTRQLVQRFPRLDTSRIVIVGHSAGGQLAIWAASRKQGEQLDQVEVAKAPIAVAGVVSLAGITDLRTYGSETGSCNAAVSTLMGGSPDQFPNRYSAVNPIERIPVGVPIWLVHGAADAIVPLSQSQSLLEQQRARGGSARLVRIELAGHFDLVAPFSTAWREVVRAVKVLSIGGSRKKQ